MSENWSQNQVEDQAFRQVPLEEILTYTSRVLLIIEP